MCVSEWECIVMCVLTGVFEQVCVSTCGCDVSLHVCVHAHHGGCEDLSVCPVRVG